MRSIGGVRSALRGPFRHQELLSKSRTRHVFALERGAKRYDGHEVRGDLQGVGTPRRRRRRLTIIVLDGQIGAENLARDTDHSRLDFTPIFFYRLYQCQVRFMSASILNVGILRHIYYYILF